MDSKIFDLPAPVFSDLTILDANKFSIPTSTRDLTSCEQKSDPLSTELGRKRKRDSSSENDSFERPEVNNGEEEEETPIPDSTQTGIEYDPSFESSFEGESNSELDSFSSNDGKPFATISGLTKHGKTFQIDFQNKNELIEHVTTNWLVDQKCQFCWNCGFQGQKPLDYIDVHLTMLATVSIRCRRLHYHVSWTSAKRCNQSGRASACSSFLHQSVTEPLVKRKRNANDSHRSWLDSSESQPSDRGTASFNAIAVNNQKESQSKSESETLSDRSSVELSQQSDLEEGEIKDEPHAECKENEEEEEEQEKQEEQEESEESDESEEYDEDDQPLLSKKSVLIPNSNCKSNFKLLDGKSTTESMSGGIFSWIGSFFKFN